MQLDYRATGIRIRRTALAMLLVTSGLLSGCGNGSGGSASGTSNGKGGTAAVAEITLLAGALGGPGNLDGTGSQARFLNERSIAVDQTGTIYLAGGVRKITPTGVVTTASGGVTGLEYADAMAFDAAGNFFRMEGTTLWKTNPSGQRTVLAGGTPGYADGQGSDAKFSNPYGLATDAVGNVYVADTGVNAIRKVTPAGVVTTLAGKAGTAGSADGTGSAALFFGPRALATDSAGNVYVGDKGNFTIRKITPAGVVSTFAGTPGESGVIDGIGSGARFGAIDSMASDSAGNLYTTDSFCTIRKIAPDGTTTTLAGAAGQCGYADGVTTGARFGRSLAIAADAGSFIYVMDETNYVVRKVNTLGTVTTLAGNPPHSGNIDGIGTEARFSKISGGIGNDGDALGVDAGGNVYLADAGGIRKISSAGVVSTLPSSAGLDRYNGLATDSTGNIYVPSYLSRNILKLSPDGTTTTLRGSSGIGAVAVAVDSDGNVFASDRDNSAIRKITPDGIVSWFVSPTTLAAISGTLCDDWYLFMTTDTAGNVYAASQQIVLKISRTGAIAVLANTSPSDSCHSLQSGPAPAGSIVDGMGSAAHFYSIGGIAVDKAGTVFLTDTNTVRKITPAGMVSTVAGQPSSAGVILGSLPGSLGRPTGITVIPSDSGTKLVVVDEYSLLAITLP